MAAFSTNPFAKLCTRLLIPGILGFSYISVASLSSEEKSLQCQTLYRAAHSHPLSTMLNRPQGSTLPPLGTQDPLAFICTPATRNSRFSSSHACLHHRTHAKPLPLPGLCPDVEYCSPGTTRLLLSHIKATIISYKRVSQDWGR